MKSLTMTKLRKIVAVAAALDGEYLSPNLHQNCQKFNVLILQQQLSGWWGGGHGERGGKHRVQGVISGLVCHVWKVHVFV